jgi:MFS family permease
VQGAANAFTSPLLLAGLADVTPEGELGRAMGTYAAVQTAGAVCAPLIGGLAGGVDYRLAFVAAAAAALVLAAVRVPTRRRAGGARHARLADALTPRAAWTGIAAFLAYLGITGISVVVALRAGDEFGLGPTARGILLAAFGAAGVVVGRHAGALADRQGATRVAIAGAVPCAALLPLMGLAPGAALLAALWLAVGIASAHVWAGLNVLTVGSAPANRGGAVSMIGALKFAGSAIAPIAWLALYDSGPEAAFAAAGASCLLLALAIERAGRSATVRRALATAPGRTPGSRPGS